MKFVLLALALAAGVSAAPPDDDQVAARRAALDLAGAWTNDGFRLRDGHITASLKTGESKLIRVNLYAGNHYWFTAAAPSKANKLIVQVFDESGRPATFESFQDEGRAAAGFAPTASGPYLIKVAQLEGEQEAPFALVYSYR
jgi:hypothetical protein